MSKYGAGVVGIRELKNRTSAIVDRVRGGEIVTVTDRTKPVAILVPIAGKEAVNSLAKLVETGRIRWKGGRPKGLRNPPVIRGRTVAETVAEDRR